MCCSKYTRANPAPISRAPTKLLLSIRDPTQEGGTGPSIFLVGSAKLSHPTMAMEYTGWILRGNQLFLVAIYIYIFFLEILVSRSFFVRTREYRAFLLL